MKKKDLFWLTVWRLKPMSGWPCGEVEHMAGPCGRIKLLNPWPGNKTERGSDHGSIILFGAYLQ
jgi:hypothetical protein